MLNKMKNIFYILSFIIFIIFTTYFYFSDQNVMKTNKSRSLRSIILANDTLNLPLLKNDTKNIIQYRDDIEVYKQKKKNYTFWDLIGK